MGHRACLPPIFHYTKCFQVELMLFYLNQIITVRSASLVLARSCVTTLSLVTIGRKKQDNSIQKMRENQSDAHFEPG